MDHLLETNSKSLPPGFRFHPTDEELFLFYLKRKVMGKSLRLQMISEVDVYRLAPWDLPDKSCMKTRDLSWYFFCPRSQKYAHGGRTNRSNECGYWKSTGNDRTVQCHRRNVGKIKTLIFHLGKAPKGERTDWVIHEYRLEDDVLADKGVHQDAYVICKVYRKSGPGPKNGEQYGAPFIEEEWETDDEDNLETNGGVVWNNGGGCEQGHDQSVSVVTNAAPVTTSSLFVEDQETPTTLVVENATTPTTCSTADHNTPTTSYVENVTTPTTKQPTPVGEIALEPIQMEEDDIHNLLAMFTEDDTDIYIGLEALAGTDGYQTTTTQTDFDWSQFISDKADCYVELDDLDRNFKN